MSDLDILGINQKASKEEVKLAYKRLAKQYHPDLNKTQKAKEKFIEINNAYNKIMNKDSLKDLLYKQIIRNGETIKRDIEKVRRESEWIKKVELKLNRILRKEHTKPTKQTDIRDYSVLIDKEVKNNIDNE